MRTLTTLLFLVLLSACNSNSSSEEEVPLQSKVQKWELVRMTGSFINSETTGDDMAWQEYYLLNPNGNFFKSRNRDGTISQATGTYAFVEQGHEKYFELTYITGKELIASCFGNGKEILMFNGGQLLGSWNACDGPGLEYQLVE